MKGWYWRSEQSFSHQLNRGKILRFAAHSRTLLLFIKPAVFMICCDGKIGKRMNDSAQSNISMTSCSADNNNML